MIKTKSATITFFLFSSFLPRRCFFFSFFFYFAGVILSLSGAKNLPFGLFLLKWLQVSLIGSFFKKSAKYLL